ncbi:MAG: MBL fold metallo-hydrolase [Woeseiaceae bacterium]|nr:MBL fold metallo-hydrolase [Woeseiaceae bacterium]
MVASLVALTPAGCGKPAPVLSVEDYSCDNIPRPENAKLVLHPVSDDYFQVYESAPGVYSIVEPYQIQETISHLILGTQRALLFDTGTGLLPIRPVVEQLTDLPVTVVNSHTHYDHIGGNWEFESVLALDTDYTQANMAGRPYEEIAIDFVPEAFCKGVPDGVDLPSVRSKPWKAQGFIEDGEIIDLGKRRLQVLHTPGHTPDALVLLDVDKRLLFTGDTWYDASLWLFAAETNLEQYEASIERLAEIERDVDFLFGAHNSARVDAGRLALVDRVLKQIRSGDLSPTGDDSGRLVFESGGVRVLTTQSALDGNEEES